MTKKTVFKIFSILLTIAVACNCIGIVAFAVNYPATGSVKGGTATIYSCPGTPGHEADGQTSQKVATLSTGDKVSVLGTGIDGDGDMWYHIKFGDGFLKEGYIFHTRVKIEGSYSTDQDFESWLTTQGFPESYKDSLRTLHSFYPNWVFYADHTDLEWTDAVNAESKVGTKLVSVSRDVSWRSLEDGAYNWDENHWYGFDGASWVAASRKIIEYYMDPRNFLDTSGIFMFYGSEVNPETENIENLSKVIKNTFLDGTLPDNGEKTYADVLLEAGRQNGVSAGFLAAVILVEQGVSGTGKSISGTYPGYGGLYNFFNIGAYAHDGRNAIENGLLWAKGGETYNRPWNSREAAILGGSQWYSVNYLKGGQDTLYYKDFNVKKGASEPPYTHQYATNIEDAYAKTSKFSSALLGSDAALTFYIPIFKNMPDKTEKPQSGSNNNLLSSLSVEGFNIGEFNRYNYNYELVVESAASVNINAVSSDSLATVTGAGIKALAVGENNFVITVTAQNGETRQYNLTISRLSNGESAVKPEITGSYKTGQFLTGVSPNTATGNFISTLGVKNGSVKILSNGGFEKTDGIICTGDRVYIYDLNSAVSASYDIVIYGDINGDGTIKSTDLLAGQRHILGLKQLTGAYLEAADINHDGTIKSTDLLAGQRHILGIKNISQ